MGIQQSISVATPPSWSAVRDLSARRQFPLQMRMIDGELAFPDEEPPATWRELRIGTPQGMVTVRREGERLLFVTWGNADTSMRQAWNAVTWAFAEVSGGRIEMDQGVFAAEEFRRTAELPDSFRLTPGAAV